MILSAKLKNIISSCLIIGLTITLTIYFNSHPTLAKETTKTSPKTGYCVVLDAGHGGVDPGSLGRVTKTTESELNLIFVNKLEQLLIAGGIDVIKTRSDENGLYGIYSRDYKIRDMKARQTIINNSNADIVVSIHMNSFIQSKFRGAQVFYDEQIPESVNLALSIQECFASDLPESNKGIAIGDYFILKCSPTIPSVLCECGYLSNAEDEKLLIDSEYQNRVVYSIYKGIIRFLSNNV